MTNETVNQYREWRADLPEMQLGNRAVDAVCHAPFVSVLFDTKGYVRSCCQSMTHSIGNITQQSLKEIWNGATNRAVREQMLAYELPQGCVTCQSDMDKGNFQQTFARLFDGFDVPNEQPEWPQNMWFLMSNACNLECVQCYGELSSSIRKHRDKLPPLKRVYHDAFFEELREFLPHLTLALFLGGEAFLSKENLRVWDMLIEDGLTPQSHIVTNGTQFNKRVERILTSLPCSVSISLDGATKATVESIRQNARFDEVMINIKKIQEFASVELSFCVMPQNHHEFADFLMLAERLGCGASANTVYQPPEFSICALPPDKLAEVIAVWESRDAEMTQALDQHRGLWEQELARLRGWIDHPDGPPSPIYLTGISSRLGMNAAPAADGDLVALGGKGASGVVQYDPSIDESALTSARAELQEWLGRGNLDQATLDQDDLVTDAIESFGGLAASDVNNRPLSVVLMLLRERYGDDVNIIEEQWNPDEMDRTMEFANLEHRKTELRWKVLASANPDSHKKIFLLAVRETPAEVAH